MNQTLKKNYIIRRAIPLLLLTLVLLSGLYIYFLSRSVLNVVMREEVEVEISALSSSIGELEFQYIALKNSVDVERAEEFGLVALRDKEYVARHSLAERGLTLNR